MFQKKTSLINLFFIIPIFFAIGAQKSDAYFRQISINNQLAFVGKYKVDEKLSKETNCYHFQYDDDGKIAIVEYLKAGKIQKDLALGIAQVKFEYEGGYEKRTYFNEKGKPCKDEVSNVYGVRIKRDEINHLLSLFNYNKKGVLTKDRYGVIQYAWQLDSIGYPTKLMCLDETGSRIVDKDGFYEIKTKYDSNGNLIELANYNKEGKLMENKGKTSILRKKYDEKGNILEEAYVSDKGELINHTISRIAVTQLKYDIQGNVIEARYLGSNQQLKEDRSGVAITKWKYDVIGNLIEESYFGIDEQPKEISSSNNSNYAVVRWKYDTQGRLTKTNYLNRKQAFE